MTMEGVSFHSSSDKSQTVRTHRRILNNYEAGILPSPPLINHSLSSYPPFSSHQKQPPLLPLPAGPSNSSINPPLVRRLSLPPIKTKPNKKEAAFKLTTFKPKQTTASAGFSKDAVSVGGSRPACDDVQGTRSLNNSSKTEQASPKLLEEMDKVGDSWESVVFTLSPPPSSLPMPSFSILRPKLRCGY